MNVSKNSQVNLNKLISKVEREGNSTGITGKTFGELVAYSTNSNEELQCANIGGSGYAVSRETGLGVIIFDGVFGSVVSNDGTFLRPTKAE